MLPLHMVLLLQDDDKVAPPVLTILLDTMLKPLLKLFVDKVEKVRELAIELLIDFVKRVTTIEPFLPYMVPAMESRMGQLEIEEPSEEVRLLHINLCAAIINKVRTAQTSRFLCSLCRA